MQTKCYVSSRRRSCSTSRRCARNYTSRRPFKAISPVTMSRWLQDVILDAGSPEGSARDVRSVGSSTAVQTNMDISKVMEAANWQRLTTMQRHCFKPQCLQSLSGILNVTSGADWVYLVLLWSFSPSHLYCAAVGRLIIFVATVSRLIIFIATVGRQYILFLKLLFHFKNYLFILVRGQISLYRG